MATVGKMLSGRIFNSRIRSRNVEGKEKWIGYLLGPCGALLINKAEEKEKIAADKQADKLAKMTPEQRAKRDARMEKRRAREDAAWEIEREKGERAYNKIQAMLKEYLAAKKGKMKE